MQRVVEMETEPIVGKIYLVPTLESDGEIVPVIGPEHDDKEYIGLNVIHYHYDLRFLSQKEINETFNLSGRAKRSGCTPSEFHMIKVYRSSGLLPPKERPMKCKRKMPVFPLVIDGSSAPWMLKLEQAYADTVLNCARCPHKGMPLSKDNADENGVVVCPGHGLAWNLETGRLVSRLNEVKA